jgi:catechol 2,3-dioxygenase-like lactoylglutathione lyase family enzyme
VLTLGRFLFTMALISTGLLPTRAADTPPRPRIVAVSQLAVYVHDIAASRKFYHDFLGFDESITLTKPDGSLRAALIKINDRQSLELLPENTPATDRLNHLALETDDAEGMRLYLRSRGYVVPDRLSLSEINSANFWINDPDGHAVEFQQYLPDSAVVRDTGKHLPDTRIAMQMSHAGVMVRHLDAAQKFYGDVLGCTETWRGSGSGKVLSWVCMKVPDGTNWVEFMLYSGTPTLAKIGINHHICLIVPDVAKTLELLRSRPLPPGAQLAPEIHIGVDRKRQIHVIDPDGTRIEIMEPAPPDGVPAESSPAPPPT